jgi:hypothetical protein
MGDIVANYLTSLGQVSGAKHSRGDATWTQPSVGTGLSNIRCGCRGGLNASCLTGTRAGRFGIKLRLSSVVWVCRTGVVGGHHGGSVRG